MAASWFVYLLTCADGTYYCGITKDMERRLAQHNGVTPGGARYTRGRRPVRMAAHMACGDKSHALTLEARIKSLPRSRKLPFFLDAGAIVHAGI